MSDENSRKIPQKQNHRWYATHPWNYFFLICENKIGVANISKSCRQLVASCEEGARRTDWSATGSDVKASLGRSKLSEPRTVGSRRPKSHSPRLRKRFAVCSSEFHFHTNCTSFWNLCKLHQNSTSSTPLFVPRMRPGRISHFDTLSKPYLQYKEKQQQQDSF